MHGHPRREYSIPHKGVVQISIVQTKTQELVRSQRSATNLVTRYAVTSNPPDREYYHFTRQETPEIRELLLVVQRRRGQVSYMETRAHGRNP